METKMIGIKITEARKKNGISQAQLAERLFISPQAVGKWERGESIPDIITFNRMAKILGVDLNYFSDDFRTKVSESSDSETVEKKVPTSAVKPNWDMSRGNWTGADFSGLKNLHEKFSSSNMQNCKFIGSDLSALHLKNNNVDKCDFSSSDFSGSHIQHSNLSNNLFVDCNLTEVTFSSSFITNCDFTSSNLCDAKFENGGIEKSKMKNAVWLRTIFNNTYLSNLNFEGAIEDCYFENCAFNQVLFQNAILLNTFFKCKSLKKIKFIDCKADRMTYEFLKNGKADLHGITLITT